MRKILLYVLTAAFAVVLCLPRPASGAVPRMAGSADLSPEDAEQTILRLLFEPVHEAVANYYGEPRQFWKPELLDTAPAASGYYQVVIRVETFCGAHNPPYGIETLTFRIGFGTAELLDFNHRDDPAGNRIY